MVLLGNPKLVRMTSASYKNGKKYPKKKRRLAHFGRELINPYLFSFSCIFLKSHRGILWQKVFSKNILTHSRIIR